MNSHFIHHNNKYKHLTNSSMVYCLDRRSVWNNIHSPLLGSMTCKLATTVPVVSDGVLILLRQHSFLPEQFILWPYCYFIYTHEFKATCVFHFLMVLLTVHLSIVLGNDQLDTQLLYFTIRLLWSSTCFEQYMLINRRLNCIDAASGIVTLSKWLSGSPDSHLLTVTIPDAASIQFNLLLMSI